MSRWRVGRWEVRRGWENGRHVNIRESNRSLMKKEGGDD
jgi:hypothetical protein